MSVRNVIRSAGPLAAVGSDRSTVSNIPVVVAAATGGSISGAVTDASGAAIPASSLSLVNDALQTPYRAVSDREGLYAFPNLPVGHYTLTIAAAGFATQRKLNLEVDSDSAMRVDVTLLVAGQTDVVTVSSENETQVETAATHLGEVVSAAQMTAIPLNGRSYTDLLSIQPGVAPVSTLLASSVIMAGVSGNIDPSGDANPGNLSINGQRESSNGFLVDGIDVQEHMNGGTSIIPNLDSIEQFRVLTNNFDPEYGNYNGGMITVVSKSGSNQLHGDAFEFFRNTALDAQGYFDLGKAAFNQSQFGGTIGGPVRRDKLFFFTDYQGTRTTQGIATGKISVPSVAERGGNFSDVAAGEFYDARTLQPLQFVSGPCVVAGSCLADVLSQRLGYAVSSGEAYSFPGCSTSGPTRCVFPNGILPQAAWSAPGKDLLQYIPSPNSSVNQFSTSAYAETVRDDKGSFRLDANTRAGQVSGYYFVDDYRLDNPYPGAVAGASIPGFDALYIGRAQLFSVGDTRTFGSKTVNDFTQAIFAMPTSSGSPRAGSG